MDKKPYAASADPAKSSTALIERIKVRMRLKNDAAVARYMEVAPAVVCKWHSGHLSFGAAHIIRLHEKTGWPVADIKAMLPTLSSKVL